MGERLKVPVDYTPGPGQYEPESATRHTKTRVQGGAIHTEQMMLIDPS
jgi:hypothetical protein